MTEAGGFTANVIHFANFLRRAGLPVGTGQVEDAVRALTLIDITHRRDVYWALHSILVSKHEHDELFGYAFAAFWRAPHADNDELATLELPNRGERDPIKPPRRILEAWQGHRKRTVTIGEDGEPADTPGTASAKEILRRRDFEQMSADEIQHAKALLRKLRFPWRDRPVRRLLRHPRGRRIDLRGTLQRSLRTGGEPLRLLRKHPARRPPPLVVLCDISGSMERYSRMVLHFLHALTNDRDRVEVFTFGTRLVRITRSLHHRDVDAAFADLSARVPDWGGGTRIGACLKVFRQRWSRRVLVSGAELLLVTDGLERDDDPSEIEAQLSRLARQVRHIRWLNPLLRYEGFEPATAGAQALHKYVTDHRPVHDLESLTDLAAALSHG